MIEYLMLIIGIILLIKGADYLIDGGSFLAKKIGVSSLFIGLTVLAFGTSLPELIISIISVLKGNSEIIFGNIIGSNMSNILLILGISSLFITIKVYESTIKKEIPYSIFAVLLLILFIGYFIIFKNSKNYLSFFEGFILIFCFAFFIHYIVLMAKENRKNTIHFDTSFKNISNYKIYLMIIGGLIAIYFGGRFTVNNAIIVANNLGLSEFFISATIIAIGTSLPELIICITAALKKEIDMLIGNIIGSNIFNILWVIGITAIIKPITFSSGLLIDLFILLFVSLFLLFIVYRYKSINKYQGIIFILLYILYIIYLIKNG
ncbi:MAG: calcium/sodium antiporter [Candidatus Woesearchaeota archaeon]